MIYFEIVTEPENLVCNTEFAAWHVLHGWCWNVLDNNRFIGIYCVTLLAGIGGVLHFDTVVADIPPAHILAGFRKAIKLVQAQLPMIFATVPTEKNALIRCLKRFGFEAVSGCLWEADGTEFVLLKYLNTRKRYSKDQ